MLDKLRETRDFKLHLESYRPEQAREIETYENRWKRVNQKFMDAVDDGNIPEALANYRLMVVYLAYEGRLRNNNYIKLLEEYASKATKRSVATKVFVRLGESHHILLEQIPQSACKALREATITIFYDYGEPKLTPYDRLVQSLIRSPRQVPDKNSLLIAIATDIIENQLLLQSSLLDRNERTNIVTRILSLITNQEIEGLIISWARDGNEAVERFIHLKDI